MKRTLEEILANVNTLIGEDISDSALGLIEDITDTLTQENTSDDTNWKEMYDQLDTTWRQKYKERFLKGSDPDPDPEPEPDGDESPKTFEKLFKED